jgi:uncharacterized protein YqeY
MTMMTTQPASKDQIEREMDEEYKTAMRGKDQPRMDVIRMVRTEASKAKTAPGFKGPVDDAFWREIIAAYVKRLEKARQEYLTLGERGKSMAEGLQFEVSYLQRWLPTKLSEGDTRALVRKVISELGISDPKQAGRVMGQVMKQHKDEVDGPLVKKLVDEILGTVPRNL